MIKILIKLALNTFKSLNRYQNTKRLHLRHLQISLIMSETI